MIEIAKSFHLVPKDYEDKLLDDIEKMVNNPNFIELLKINQFFKSQVNFDNDITRSE